MTPAVRAYHAADLQAVAQLWFDSWAASGLVTADAPGVEAYRARLAGEGRGWRILVACGGAQVLGFMACEPEAAWLRQLFVRPDAQRQGVGAALLLAARAEMPDGFWLRTDADNAVARGFYARQGLRDAGEGVHPVHGHKVATYRWP